MDPLAIMPASSLLQIDISLLRRGGRVLFRDFSLSLSPGNCVHITGPNGVGKSSLLRAMVGLLPFQGTILKTPNIFFLPTEGDFCPGQTVHEYQQLWRTFEEVILNDSSLTPLNQEKIFLPKDVFTKRIDRLSSGMQQRVNLSRLGNTRALLWILDEPWQHLDREAAAVLDACIIGHLKLGGAVVFTSHDQRVFSFETASVDLTALIPTTLAEDAWPF